MNLTLESLPELILLAPRPDALQSFEELASRISPVVDPIPIRVASAWTAPDKLKPQLGAGLIASGHEETRLALASGQSWSWFHLMASGPDPMETWGRIPGNPLITYSRGVNAHSIAEWVVGATLYFYKEFDLYLEQGRTKTWERRWSRELSGRRVTVLGAGAAGTEVARAASALGMTVIGISRSGRTLPGFAEVLPAKEGHEIWRTGDVTVILLPLTAETRGTIGRQQLARLKEGSLLLVVSRGGIVDEQAVVEAVDRRSLRGAAFDVFSEEPLPPTSPLWGHPRILLTPHVAGTTDQFMQRTADVVQTITKALRERDEQALEHFRWDHPSDST